MSPPRPKVLVLASTFPRWNGDRQPRFVLDLCKGLADRFDILVLAPHAPGAALAETLEGIPVRRFRYWIPRWQSLAYGGGMLEQVRGNPLRLLQLPFLLSALILATRRALADDGHSLIHAHWIIPQGVAAAAVRGRTPLVCTAHGADAFGLRAKPFLALKRWVLGRSTALTVVSEAIASQLRPLLPHPMDTPVMPMGADLRDTFTPDESVEREPMRLVFAGRMVEKKGVEVLLRALPAVLDKHPGIRLHIVGTGPREATLRTRATDLGLEARVVFHGALD
ncbi:MAG: glycosyltransferase, partial [Gammaproteobacteria bacterium]